MRLSRTLEARIERKLYTYSAGLTHHEMDFGAGTRGLGTELDDDARPGRHSLVEGIEADRGRVRQILNNLFTNALEALEGVAAPSLEVVTRLEGLLPLPKAVGGRIGYSFATGVVIVFVFGFVLS